MKKTKTKFDHKIYIRAAEHVDVNNYSYSCNAIYHACSSSLISLKYEDIYQKTFDINPNKCFGLTPKDIDSDSDEDLKQFRILALLFMAEFVKSLNEDK